MARRLRQTKIRGTRHLPGTWVEGEFQDGGTEALEFWGTIQNSKPEEVELIPEGERDSESVVVLTETPLRPASDDKQTAADRLEIPDEIDGGTDTFKVVSVSPDRARRRTYYKAILVKEA